MSALAHYYDDHHGGGGGASERVGLLYVDADCDMLVPGEAGSSGNMAAMAGTHLTRRAGALDSMKPFSRPDGSAVVDRDTVVFFGLNVDSPANRPRHLGYLLDGHFRVFTSRAVAAEAALRWLEERVDRIHVHLDVDAIDPGTFPLCNVPSFTGVGFDAIMSAVRIFLGSPKAAGSSVAEVNPDHDPGLAMTSRLVDELVAGMADRREQSRNARI